MIVPHSAPGCSKLPVSAVSLSRKPLKGAVMVKRSISFSAAAMPASADWMPACAASTPDCAPAIPASADCTAACALSNAACADATRVSEAKPSSNSFFAPLRLISASLNLARASAKRPAASGIRASASGMRASASGRRARASARLTSRVPGSSWHSNWPASTTLPLRNGSDTTLPDVSARTSTCRAASVRPRSNTTPEIS